MHSFCLRGRLTHWGRVTHICVGNLTIIGSDNGLSPGRRQAIIWTNAGILSIGPLGTNFNEISIGIQRFSFKKMHFKMSSAKWRPFCLGLNVLMECCRDICWCRCPCFSVFTSRRKAKLKRVCESVPLTRMSHVHAHVLGVAKPFYTHMQIINLTVPSYLIALAVPFI